MEEVDEEVEEAGADGQPIRRKTKVKRRKCGNCYGAGEEGECCNTCYDVKMAYDKKGTSSSTHPKPQLVPTALFSSTQPTQPTHPPTTGWAFMGLNVEQCEQERLKNPLGEEEENEGCNIHGSLLLTQESGNVHFAPGEQLRHSGALNVADLVMFTFLKFNISHEIHHLSLGEEFPGFASPLSNQVRSVADGYGMYQYYLKVRRKSLSYLSTHLPTHLVYPVVQQSTLDSSPTHPPTHLPLQVVPTVYKHLDKPATVSNQYAVTEHVRHINPGSNRGLPGVWFFYDTSPVHVEFQERRKGLLPFLTSVCAIVGGVFSVFGVVDGLIHNLVPKMPGSAKGAPGS